MKNRKIILLVFVFLCCCASADKCLDSLESYGRCTQCESTNFLHEGKCYEKIKGCLQHQVLGESAVEVTCTLCQNGYVFDTVKCQRIAVVQLRRGLPPAVLNNPSPIASENSGKLQKQIIKQIQEANRYVQKEQKAKIKSAQKFPELKIGNSIDEKTLNEKQEEIPADLSKLINDQYPQLAKEHYFKLMAASSEISESRYFLVYEQGTILLIDKKQNKNVGNIKSIAQGSEIPQYSVVKIGQNKNVRNHLNLFKSKSVGDTISLKLDLNFQIKAEDSQSRGYFNIDLNSGSIRPILKNDEQQLPVYLMRKRKQYQRLLEQAYKQFLDKITVLNVPQQILDVKIFQNKKQSEVVFKVIYSVLNQTETEFSVFKYRIDKNETEVMGYFIEGSNVLAYFNTSNQTSSNYTNSTTNVTESLAANQRETTDKQKESGVKAPPRILEKKDVEKIATEPFHNQTANKTNATVQAEVSTKNISILPRQLKKNDPNQTKPEIKTNFTQNRQQKKLAQAQPKQNITQIQKEPNTTSVKTEIQPVQAPKIQPVMPTQKWNLTAEVKNLNDLLVALKLKPEFSKKIEKGYRVISLESEISQTKPEITYKLRILLPTGITLIKIAQNIQKKQCTETYTSESSQNCIQLPENDPIFSKLDTSIRRSYPVLQAYNKFISEYKQEQNMEKYLFIYTNQQAKKVFYEVSKAKDSVKYTIVRSGVHENGFYFDKKDMEAINLKISDFQQQKYDKNSSAIKAIKLALSELVQRFRPYVYNSTVLASITNSTHMKIYIQNKVNSFEFVFKVEQAFGKANLTLIDKKYGYDVWPVGTKKALIAYSDPNIYQKIEDAILKKYKFYFSNGTNQIYLKKSVNDTYQIAFKTLFGYFSISATVGTEVTLGLLKKSSQIDESKTSTSCQTGQLHDSIDKKCYQKIPSCYKQIGNVCISCDAGYILQTGMKDCKRACAC